MPIATTGSNTTGSKGLVAVDKVGNKIRFLDPATLREIKAFDGPEPCVHELALSPDRNKAWVPLYGDGIYGNNKRPNNKLLVLDLVAQRLDGIIELGSHVAPHGMVATADDRLWVVCDIPRKLLEIDTARGTVLAAYDCPVIGPHILISNADGSRLIISAKEGDVTVFDTAARKFVAAVSVRGQGIETGNGSGSEGVTPTPDGRRLIAVDNDRGDLRVIDMTSWTEIDRVPLAMQPYSNPKRSRLAKIMVSPDGRHLVVTGYTGGNVWLIDPANLARQTVVAVAKGPMGIAFPPDGESVIVSSHDSGLLTRIDLAQRKAVAAYDGGTGIEVLAYY